MAKNKQTQNSKLPTNPEASLKTKDRKASEEKLLKAAEYIFSKHGYQGATTRMIAEKANLNLALINRYFDGKFGLLLKIIETKALECQALEYEARDNLIDELDCYVESSLKQFYDEINLFKIVLVQYLTDPKFLKKFKEIAELFSNDQQLKERVRLLIDAKKVSPNFPYELAIKGIDDMIFGLIVGETLLYNKPYEELFNSVTSFVRFMASPYDVTKTN